MRMTSFLQPFAAIVLAAGLGKRFKSSLPKVLHEAAGKPLVHQVMQALEEAGSTRTVVVVGHGAAAVKESILPRWPDAEFVEQAEQLGTGHAVACCEAALGGFDGHVVVLNGDAPLINPSTIRRLVDDHVTERAAVTLLSAELEDPFGYGRIVREGDQVRIVEQSDATDEQAKIKEVSSGTWCFDARSLFDAIRRIGSDNAQGEFYLPDAALVIGAEQGRINIVKTTDPDEVAGANDRFQLAEVSARLRRRRLEELALSGVTIVDPSTTFIDAGVEVGADTVIHPLTFLEGSTAVGSGCTIGPSVRIVDSTVGDRAEITFAVVIGSNVGEEAKVGPFASLRPGTELGARSKVGTFVETKATRLGEDSKVPHLSYMGDAEIGRDVNVGAGTITCNYDGETKTKSKTVIGDEVLIGSDTMLVAPVTLGDRSVTAAGAVVTKDVPEGQVAVGAPAKAVRARRTSRDNDQASQTNGES